MGWGSTFPTLDPLRQWWYIFVKNKITTSKSEGQRESEREVFYSLIVLSWIFFCNYRKIIPLFPTYFTIVKKKTLTDNNADNADNIAQNIKIYIHSTTYKQDKKCVLISFLRHRWLSIDCRLSNNWIRPTMVEEVFDVRVI